MNNDERKVPKYFKISREIISAIRNGEYLPGMKVLSENELISKYKISNTTAPEGTGRNSVRRIGKPNKR